MILMFIFAVLFIQVNTNAPEELLGESVKEEVENLKRLVIHLQKASDSHSQKIHSLEKTSEDQQRIIDEQQKILKELLLENRELRDKQQNMASNQKNKTSKTTDDKQRRYRSDTSSQIKQSRNERLLSEPASVLPVAFYAFMSAPATYSNNHHVLVFDTVKTNIGNSFHHTTGVFMVPLSGLYAFTWTLREANGSHHSVALVVNNEEYGAVYQNSHSGDYDQTSTTVVLNLSQGDDVYLRTRVGAGPPNGDMISNPFGRTSFSGWKIN